MNHLDSDLEEGEIVDDSPPPPHINKNKELPRRYVVSDNKNGSHKHKRNCRHSIRHHAKKLSKLKKTPTKMKNSPKRFHKSSCAHEKSHKVPGKYNSSHSLKQAFPKNGCVFQNSPMESSLKNVSPLNNLSTNLDKPRPRKILSLKQNFKASKSNFAPFDMSSAKISKHNNDNSMVNSTSTNVQCPSKSANSNQYPIDLNKSSDDVIIVMELSPSKKQHPLIDLSKSPDDDDMPNTTELNSNNVINNVDNSNNSAQVKDEESEDEEELRRIALATFAKRKAAIESENETVNADCSSDVPALSNVNNVQISVQEKNNLTADNYEVVDMEVDEEVQDSSEAAQTSLINQNSGFTENLFVIDTNPSNDLLQNKETSSIEKQVICNSSDDEFETDILRAELINSMYRKKMSQEDLIENSNVASHEMQTPVMQQKKLLINHQKSNLRFSNKRLKSAKHFLRKRLVNKLVNVKNNNPTPLPTQANKPPEKLIITVNGESSDDSDDDSDAETNTVSENPVEIIEALISDCRQKSQTSTETKEREVVSEAVSCLSKAQQEEYNALMKILAKKKKLSPAQETSPPKNGSIHSPLDDLKKLEEKLVVLRGTLKNKKDSMVLLSKEVNTKKNQYVKLKLTAQHLKEKWIAAEKVRKERLLEWSGTCGNLKLMKKSVSNLENKINEVQNLCSKLGSTLKGQSYKLPLFSGNEQS